MTAFHIRRARQLGVVEADIRVWREENSVALIRLSCLFIVDTDNFYNIH